MSLFKSGFIVAGSTFVSRIFGYVRDVFIASYLGTTDAMDVFAVAWRLPNFFRNLFAEGALSTSFVPILSAKFQSVGEKKAYDFASQVLTILVLVLIIFVGTIEIFMPQLMHLLAPGFLHEPYKFLLVVNASQITMPYLLLISVCSLYCGILNVKNKFMIGALVPVILSLTMICTLILFDSLTHSPVISLSVGVLFAGFIQLFSLYLSAKSAGIELRIVTPKISPDIKLLFKKMLPAIIGSSLVQLNLWVDTVIATTLDGAASKLYYAERLNQFPLAIIGTAIGTVLLPSLSKEIENKNFTYVSNTFERSVIVGLVFSVAASIGLLSIGKVIISVLFERGEFTHNDTHEVSLALQMLAVGLPAFILVKVFIPFYYSKLDTQTPLKIALLCVVLNVIFSLTLIKFISYAGIPLATSLSAWINVILLKLFLLKDPNFKPDYRLLGYQIFKIFLCAVIMFLTIQVLQIMLEPMLYGNAKIDKLIALCIVISLSGIIYLSLALHWNVLDKKLFARLRIWKR